MRLTPIRLIGEPENSSRKPASSSASRSASRGAASSARGTKARLAAAASANGSTGRPRGSRRSRRCGCRSPRGIRRGSGRRARSSGRRCSAAHRAGAGRGKPAVGQASRQRCTTRKPAVRRGASGASSRVVKIAPRNSQLPCSRLTRLVCLPCQPMPAASASGFSITGAVSTKTLSSRRRLLDEAARQRLQRLLDRLVIVTALGIDRDPRRARAGRRAPADRTPAHSSCRARSTLCASGHSAERRHAMVRALLHPAHRPVMALFEPALEVEPGRGGRSARAKPQADEAEPLGFGPYCFLKALARYPRRAPVHLSASKASIGIFSANSASTGSQRPRRFAIEARGLVKDFGDTRASTASTSRSRRRDLRHARPQRRRQDDHAAHAARHHRPDERHPPRARPRAPARAARESATCPRNAASIRR